jgi:hypothetical protein
MSRIIMRKVDNETHAVVAWDGTGARFVRRAGTATPVGVRREHVGVWNGTFDARSGDDIRGER